MLDILSMGYDCLNQRNVRLLVRLIGTYYYNLASYDAFNARYSNLIDYMYKITYDMTIDEDILPLYRSLCDILGKYKLNFTDPTRKLIALLCLIILESRMRNRNWTLYSDKHHIDYNISDGNTYIPIFKLDKGDSPITVRVDSFSSLGIKDVDIHLIKDPNVLVPGSDIFSILKDTYPITIGRGHMLNILIDTVLKYKTQIVMDKIGSDVFNDRNTTYFSRIPDMSRFR